MFPVLPLLPVCDLTQIWSQGAAHGRVHLTKKRGSAIWKSDALAPLSDEIGNNIFRWIPKIQGVVFQQSSY